MEFRRVLFRSLARVFEAAEDKGAVLLFDEADALFGKRSEVKDAHDRYANIAVAYLLERVERLNGLAIFAVSTRQNLDPAFPRRLCFPVDCTRPDHDPEPRPDDAHRPSSTHEHRSGEKRVSKEK